MAGTHWLTDRYQLHEKLGDGATGSVYRASDRLTGQQIALKRVPTAQQQPSRFGRRAGSLPSLRAQQAAHSLTHEFATLATLRHPHIVTVLDYGLASAYPNEPLYPFFTMELLNSQRTFTTVAHTLPLAERLRLLLQVLQALTYLHRHGVLHRDIKPSNILVDDAGLVRLIDFGLASVSASSTYAQDMPNGAIAYLAPELIEHSAEATITTDLYAVGITAYELLTGRHPFLPASHPPPRPDYLLQRIRQAKIDWSHLAPALAAVLARLTAYQPHDRFTSAQAAADALCDAVGWPPAEDEHRVRESFLQAARLVGRAKPLKKLQTALSKTLSGRGGLWLIGGESGVGKSRLLDKLRISALVEGTLVVAGQATLNGSTPYRVWRDPLRRLVLSVALNDVEAGTLRPIIPDIEALLNRPVPDPPSLGVPGDRQRLIMTVRGLIVRYCQPDGTPRPLVILMEDLHWASESLELIQHLTPLCRELPLLMVGTYRDDEAHRLHDLNRHEQNIRLERLNEADIAQLSEAMLGDVGRNPALIELLWRESEGNVFFIVEVVRALAERAGSLAAIQDLSLPEQVFAGGMRHMIQRRLARVPEDARTLLKLAAVVGREIDLAVLRDLFTRLYPDMASPENDPDTVFATKESPQAKFLMVCANAAVLEVVHGQWRFVHDKLREALLGEINPEERPTLYRIAAEVIESIYPGNTHIVMLMQHWRVAGDAGRELHYAQLAAHQYITISRFHELRALCNHVLEAHSHDLDTRTRMTFLNHLAYAHFVLSAYDRAHEQYEQNLQLARLTHTPHAEAEALYGLGIIAEKHGQFVLAALYLEQSLAIQQQHNYPEGLAATVLALGVTASKCNDLDTAQRRFHESLLLRQQLGITTGVARSYTGLGTIATFRGDFDTAQQHFDTAIGIAEATGDRMGSLMARNNLGWMLELRGDLTGAETHFRASLALAEEVGSLWDATNTRVNLLFISLKCEQFEGLASRLHSALYDARRLNATKIVLEALIAYGLYWLMLGKPVEAAQLAGMIQASPINASRDISNRLDLLLTRLNHALPPHLLDSALKHGRDMLPDEVVEAVLANEGRPW